METTKKIYAPEELTPFLPIHPGEMLKDELDSRGISQRHFAEIIGTSSSFVNEIVKGKRPITTETALKIEAATGIKAYIWVNLQNEYNMQMARNDSKLASILHKIRTTAAML